MKSDETRTPHLSPSNKRLLATLRTAAIERARAAVRRVAARSDVVAFGEVLTELKASTEIPPTDPDVLQAVLEHISQANPASALDRVLMWLTRARDSELLQLRVACLKEMRNRNLWIPPEAPDPQLERRLRRVATPVDLAPSLDLWLTRHGIDDRLEWVVTVLTEILRDQPTIAEDDFLASLRFWEGLPETLGKQVIRLAFKYGVVEREYISNRRGRKGFRFLRAKALRILKRQGVFLG